MQQNVLDVWQCLILFSGELRIQAHGRGNGTGYPVNHDVVQQFVRVILGREPAVHQMFIAGVRPRGELFQYVCRQTGWRIVQADSCMVNKPRTK